MTFIKADDILSELIEENIFLIPVVNRFGIKMGLGDKNISQLCVEHDINIDFFLTVLNTFSSEDFFPEKKLQKFDIELVVNYLTQADAYYTHSQILNIEKHLNAFISMSDPNNKQLKFIRTLFDTFKIELLRRIETGIDGDDNALALLLDIKNILIKHISGSFNENLCYAVIFSIDSLYNDMEKHNRIREKILKPKIKELKDSGVDDWQSLILSEKGLLLDKNQPLSQRELDVLRFIALGLLNKEIADKLNISLNTVLSHRKHITSKLGIKTVSGLTFYCLSHGYISSESIEG